MERERKDTVTEISYILQEEVTFSNILFFGSRDLLSIYAMARIN